MNGNRAGGTSQRCGNPPAIISQTSQNLNTGAPKVLSPPELLSRLSGRGVRCDSKDLGAAVLGKMSYQHLLPYVRLLEEGSHQEHSIRELHRLAVFDRKLQSVVLEYVGLFELQLRAQYADAMGRRFGAFAHTDPHNFKNRGHFDGFMKAYRTEVSKQLRCGNRSISRSIEAYGEAPIWEAVEIMPFGVLSKLYNNTRPKSVRHEVSDSFGVASSGLSSWLRSLTVVRNTCAHFSPLVGQRVPYSPARMDGVSCDNSTPFYAVLVLERLLSSADSIAELPDACYGIALAQDITDLFNAFSDMLPLSGIPNDWYDIIVSKPVLGFPVARKVGKPSDGGFWFTLADAESGRLIKFDRWGGRVIDADVVNDDE